MTFTPTGLVDYFLSNNRRAFTKCKIEIGMAEGDIFWLLALLEDNREEGARYELFDQVESAEKFMQAYSIKTITDLNNIDHSMLWSRFMQQQAECLFTNGDDNTICFKLFRNKTMIYSLDLSYYDEAFEPLTKLPQIQSYIEEHWDELEELSYKK